MDSLRIETGVKRITINGDESRVIEFNPEDILFVERFYELINDFEKKEVEFKKRAEEIAAVEGVDSYGIALNTGDSLKLAIELCQYLRAQIDKVFGDGTSKTVFGEHNTLNMFEQFFNGIVPFIQSARNSKVKKYLSDEHTRRSTAD